MLAAQDLHLAGRLSGITAALRPGEVTAICGPNGAGKSSLLSALAGLLQPEHGRVMLDRAPLASLSPAARAQAIGYLPQGGAVAWDLPVAALVALGRLPHGDRSQAKVAAAITAMALEPLRHRPVSQLSGGELARALIARVLAGAPRWILADEPLANLDLAHAATLIAALRAEAAAGTGVVLVLHDLAQAMNHASRVLVLHQGVLVADARPETALAEDVISRVWGIRARWLGAAGARALAIG